MAIRFLFFQSGEILLTLDTLVPTLSSKNVVFVKTFRYLSSAPSFFFQDIVYTK